MESKGASGISRGASFFMRISYTERKMQATGIHEECGVFGVYSRENIKAAQYIYYGLTALQHRGQESAGMAVCDTCGPIGNICAHKDMGLVNEVFDRGELARLVGNIGIGHVRYSTAGGSTKENFRFKTKNFKI